MQVLNFIKKSTIASCDVVVPSKNINARIEERLQEYARKVTIPGFRKNKSVPIGVLRNRFGNRAFAETAQEMIDAALKKVISENRLSLAMKPSVEIQSTEKDKDLKFSLSLVLLPKITLVDLVTIKVEKVTCKVDESDVTGAIRAMAKGDRAFTSVERAAKKGDVVVIDFVGKVNGDVFEGGKATGYSLDLGEEAFIPGFEAQLENKKKGDVVEVKVTFPNDYHAAKLAGVDAVFTCTIKDVKVPKEALIDDDFAKKFGAKTVASLRHEVEKSLKNRYDRQLRIAMKTNIFDQLDACHSFDVHPKMVEAEFNNIWQRPQAAKSLDKMDASSESDDKDKKSDNALKDDSLRKEYWNLAKRRIRLGLIITEIAGALKVEVTDQDIRSVIMAEAHRHPEQKAKILKYYENNSQALEKVRSSLLEEKAIDALLTKATVTTRELAADSIISMLKNAQKQPK